MKHTQIQNTNKRKSKYKNTLRNFIAIPDFCTPLAFPSQFPVEPTEAREANFVQWGEMMPFF